MSDWLSIKRKLSAIIRIKFWYCGIISIYILFTGWSEQAQWATCVEGERKTS